MSSEGYTSLGVREDTRDRVRDLCEKRRMTTDQLLRDLLDGADKNG
jgi:hypothetical protein